MNLLIKKSISQLLVLFTSIILLLPYKSFGQTILTDSPILVKPNGYYVADVTDERKGGIEVAVAQFIKRNLPKDKSLLPIIVVIKELSVKETKLIDVKVEGQLKLSLSFRLQKNYGYEHLVDYNGGLKYTRQGNNDKEVHLNQEVYIKSILKNSFDYLNNWMKNNADNNPKLARNVKISFTDYTEQLEGDTIYYSRERPLTWADFQSRHKPPGNFEALVMPGFGYNQKVEVVKGTIQLEIAVKTYLPKSASWANYSSRDSYSLNHEQRHFDIVKIITNQFKKKILAANLNTDTFEGFINMQYLDSYRDMDALQKAYDGETRHGTDRSAQADWNNKIDNDLKIIN